MGLLKKIKKEIKRGGRKLEKEVSRSSKDLGQYVINPTMKAAGDLTKETVGATADALVPDINIPAPPEEKVMPLPDEALSITARRKQRARRRGSRSASILSDQESLG